MRYTCTSSKILWSILFAFSSFIPQVSAQWSELGGSNSLAADDWIVSLHSDAAGNIYATGQFANSSGNDYVAKWDGSSWSELGGLNGLAANDWVLSLCSDTAGNLYAAGNFTNSSGNQYVVKWDGSNWSEVGGLNGLAANNTIAAICSDVSGNIYAAGNFTNSSLNHYVAKWDGSSWSELGGLDGLAAYNSITALCTDTAGNLYAAGAFANDSLHTYVAKWDGSSWSELGGLNSLPVYDPDVIMSLCTDASGNIYAAGYFSNSSGKKFIAKWDGSSWSELGGPNSLAANDGILSVCSDASGNIYAGGWFGHSVNRYVAKWDGTSWSELGGINSLAANDPIACVYSDAAGNIYAAGSFTNSSGNRYVATYPAPPVVYTITTSANPSVAGTTTGDGTYSPGDTATVIATTNNGFTFNNWTESGNIVSTDSIYTFIVSSSRNLVAEFSPAPYTIKISVNPFGSGITAGGGNYLSGVTATLIATANNGFIFDNWTENGSIVSADSIYAFTVSSGRTLVAEFSPTTGVNETVLSFLTIYPTSGTGNISVTFDKNCFLEIYNHAGQLVSTRNLRRGKTDLFITEKGIYLFVLVSEGGEIFDKRQVIIQ